MLPYAFCVFILFGVVLVLLGASSDDLARTLSLDLEQIGLIGALLSLGIGAGVVVSGPLVDRFPRRPLLVVATLLVGLALVSLESPIRFARLAAHVLVMGFGAGFCETLLNTVIVERFRERSVRPITLIHSAATLGAMLGPPVVGLLAASHDWSFVFRLTGWGWLLIALWTAGLPFSAPPRLEASGRALLSPTLAALCLVGFAYVGIETALTLFSVSYATEALSIGAERGQASISSFWFGLLVGRLGLAAMAHRADLRVLVAGGGAAACVLGVGVASGFPVLELVVGLCGIVIGGVFPLMVALAGQWFPEARGSATGLVIGVGCVGGVFVPWVTGFVAQRGDIALGFGSLALWGVAISLAALLAGRFRARATR